MVGGGQGVRQVAADPDHRSATHDRAGHAMNYYSFWSVRPSPDVDQVLWLIDRRPATHASVRP